MRFLLFIALLTSTVGLRAQSDSAAYDQMLKEYYSYSVPLMQPAVLYKRLMNGDKIHLLDARESAEYQISALKGALNVGFLFYTKNKVDTFKKSDLIVVYCTIGARSETVGEKLIKAGYTNVYNLYGGIIYWKNKGYPVYHNNQQTEEVHVYSKKWGVWLTNGKARY